MADHKVLLQADFAGLDDGAAPPADWWVEGGERVWIEDGRLHIKADPGDNGLGNVCTVWHRTPIAGDVRVEFDACCVASTIDANNINFFLFYSAPDGRPLEETRDERADGAYRKYHVLNGYIFTFLNDFAGEGGKRPDGTTKARLRFRRCPGFELETETYDYHCRQGTVYHITITRRGGHITFAVDGTAYLEWTDPEPWREGLIGLRTFRTDLWWDNIRVVSLAE